MTSWGGMLVAVDDAEPAHDMPVVAGSFCDGEVQLSVTWLF